MNNTMVPDSLDFMLFFNIDFDGWCFVIQSVALVALKEVDMKNVVKSS